MSSLISVLYIYPSRIREKHVEFFYVLDEYELPRKGVKRIDFSYKTANRKINTRAYIVASKKGVIAISPVCSHLGCLVNWDKNKSEFLCPCHKGKYDMHGNVIDGPPPLPLTRLPLMVKNEKVYVGIKV